LRSVTALQRSASRPDPEPSVSAGANSLMSNELDSVIPDSVAQHMAAIKEGKSSASTQTAGTLKAEATPPVNVPVVPSSDSSESIAKQIEVSKRETAKSDKPSSADVIAAYKNKNAKADSKAKSDAQVAAAKIAAASTATTDPRQAGEKKGTAERRPTVSSFANAGSGVPATAKADSKTLRATEKTHESPDIIIVDRVRSPEVPESITNGRITAESLLKSAEDKKEVETASTPSTPTQEQVTAKVPEGGIENPMNQNIESDSRIPSITDYAKSLDRKLGSVGGQRIALSSDDPN